MSACMNVYVCCVCMYVSRDLCRISVFKGDECLQYSCLLHRFWDFWKQQQWTGDSWVSVGSLRDTFLSFTINQLMLETWGWVGVGGEKPELSGQSRANQNDSPSWMGSGRGHCVCTETDMCKKSGRRIWIGCNGGFGNGVIIIIIFHSKHPALVIPCHIVGMLVTEMPSAWTNR